MFTGECPFTHRERSCGGNAQGQRRKRRESWARSTWWVYGQSNGKAMMPASRYETVGEWTTVTRFPNGMKVEISDIRDKRDGRIYREGCYRVSGGDVRTKRWYGEMAWMNAERYANDAAHAARMRGEW